MNKIFSRLSFLKVDKKYFRSFLAATILVSGFFVAVNPALGASSDEITTISVSNLSPASVLKGDNKVPLMTFTVKSSDTSEKLEWVKVQYSGTNKADVSNVYLYRENDTSGGTFDSASDIQMTSDSVPSGGGEFNLNPSDFAISQNVDYQFYVAADISGTATLGNSVDVKISKNKIKFDSGTWPNDTDTSLFDPAGSSLIKANQTITVTSSAPANATYNSTFPVVATASSGLPVAITTSGSCSGSGSNSATITMTSGTGTCTVSYNQAGDSNYNPAPEVTENTVAQPMDITVTADDQTKTYGDDDPALTYTNDPLVGSDSLNGTLVRDAGENVGDHVINQGSLANDNYNIDYVEANLTIDKRPITVTADAKSKTYGNTLIFAGTEFTTSDLVSGDSVTNITLTSTGTDALAPVGTYDIVPSAAIGTGLANYIINYVNGILTVNKANPVITWTTPVNITYPTPLSSTQLNATTSVTGTFVYTPNSGTILSIGNGQTLSVNFTPIDTTNYNSVSASTTVNVLRATSFNATPDDLSSFNDSQALIPESGSSYNSTPTLTVTGNITINISTGSGTSQIILPAGTVISKVNGENIDGSALTASSTSGSALSGLGSGVIVDGALQWGITNLGLQFNPSITIKIFVGDSFNGQTLNIVRSISGNDGWTNDGIDSPATCVVSGGLCTFSATKASYYAATHTPVSTPTPSGGGGGGGGVFFLLMTSPTTQTQQPQQTQQTGGGTQPAQTPALPTSGGTTGGGTTGGGNAGGGTTGGGTTPSSPTTGGGTIALAPVSVQPATPTGNQQANTQVAAANPNPQRSSLLANLYTILTLGTKNKVVGIIFWLLVITVIVALITIKRKK